MTDIEVTIEPGDEASGTEDVADAIDTIVDNEQSMLIGSLTAKVSELESKCAEYESKIDYLETCVSLHDHSGLATGEELSEVEDRICARIEAEQPEIDETPPPDSSETETSDSSDSGETSDTPPKSRANRRSIAEMYYGG